MTASGFEPRGRTRSRVATELLFHAEVTNRLCNGPHITSLDRSSGLSPPKREVAQGKCISILVGNLSGLLGVFDQSSPAGTRSVVVFTT
jgi:hypothetical protein